MLAEGPARSVSIGAEPVRGLEVPTFDVLERGRWIGYAFPARGPEHRCAERWTAFLYRDRDLALGDPIALRGDEGVYATAASSADLICVEIERLMKRIRSSDLPVPGTVQPSGLHQLKHRLLHLAAGIHPGGQ